jgi:hypothetical protein
MEQPSEGLPHLLTLGEAIILQSMSKDLVKNGASQGGVRELIDPTPHRPRLRPYATFLAEIDKTSCTGWRYAKKGWVTLTNIAGKNYISAESEDEFLRRAEAGEFARAATVPRRGRNGGAP